MCEAMSRKKFEDLKSFTHFADNNILDTSDNSLRLKVCMTHEQKLEAVFFYAFYFIHTRMTTYTRKNSS